MTDDASSVLAGHPYLEFQPAVDLATGRLLGFEALVRWSHPTRGNISPAVLIPWAEANNDIIALNAWVLAEACHQAQRWPSGIQLAVNCSIVQLRQGEASRATKAAIERSGINPDRLTVEITEQVIADERAAADLQALTALGVHLAADDVGTMWSSLNALRRSAIETVKIDAAFIANLEADEGMNRAIVDAIVHVGQSLAMSTVAEGVETAAQVAILREFGTDVAQGYFFARPMSVGDACELAGAEPRAVYSLTTSGALQTVALADAMRPDRAAAMPAVPRSADPGGTAELARAAADPGGTAGSADATGMADVADLLGDGPATLVLLPESGIDLPGPGPNTRLAIADAAWPPADVPGTSATA